MTEGEEKMKCNKKDCIGMWRLRGPALNRIGSRRTEVKRVAKGINIFSVDGARHRFKVQ